MATERDTRNTASSPKLPSGLVGALLAPLALAAALAAAVLVYQTAFPGVSEEQLQPEQAQSNLQGSAVEEAPSYNGVPDPWVLTGYFTLGDAELDAQIKEFCDCFSGEGTTSSAIAAQTVYNNIIWGNYTEREAGQQPQGRDWFWVAARLYFDAARPQEGEAGDGDYYEYAAAFTCCLHYFGYTYATALPVVTYDEWGNQSGSAICYVIDESGARYVCDPSQGTEGWMLDAATQDILVDDIGQDLSDAQMLGLPIVSADDAVVDGTQTETYENEYGTYDEYGAYDDGSTYDEYGTYDDSEYGYEETYL